MLFAENVLHDDFLLFVTITERKLIKKSIDSFSTLTQTEMDDLIDFFQSFGLLELPKENEILEQIRTISENVLCKEPYELIKKMKDGIPLLHEQFFLNLTYEKLKLFYKKEKPTALKIVNCLVTSPLELNNIQSKVFYYFKTFIRNLTGTNLSKLLMFITSSEQMPEKINIFFKNFGYPVAHSCSNTLELPTSYSNYQELSDVLTTIINHDNSYEFSIL